MSDLKNLIDGIVQKKLDSASTFKHCQGTVVETLTDGKVNVNTQYGNVKVVNRSGKTLQNGQSVWIYYWDKLSNGYIGVNVNGETQSGGVGKFTNSAHTDEIFNDYQSNFITYGGTSGGYNRVTGLSNEMKSSGSITACSVGGACSKIEATKMYGVYTNGYNNSIIATSENTYNTISGCNNQVTGNTISRTCINGDNNNISANSTEISYVYIHGNHNKYMDTSQSYRRTAETSMYGSYNKATDVEQCGLFGYNNEIIRASTSYCLGYSNYINKNNALDRYVVNGIAVGCYNEIYKNYSLAIGRYNTIYSYNTYCFGDGNNMGSSDKTFSYGCVFGINNSINAEQSSVFGSGNNVNGRCSTVLGSNNTIENGDYKTAIGTHATVKDNIAIAFGVMGNGGGSGHNAVTIDTSSNLSACGNIFSTGSGYAEVWTWADGDPDNENRDGLIVATAGNSVKPANSSEQIIGVVVSQPSYISDSVQEVSLSSDAQELRETTKLPQYCLVVYFGKVVIQDDGTCEVGNYCGVSSENGIATNSETETKITMLERIDENHILALLKP